MYLVVQIQMTDDMQYLFMFQSSNVKTRFAWLKLNSYYDLNRLWV